MSRYPLLRLSRSRPGTAPRFRLAPAKDDLNHQGHNRCVQATTEAFSDEESEVSPMQDWDSEGASYAEMPVGTLPGNYEEVYGPTTKAVLRRRYWDRGAGNTRMRSYVPVDYGTTSYGGNSKEDIYRMMRESYIRE
eukprot:CAMPEP_0194479672 /NCGR_PEP_ID=MMETSP0253-20130528/2717_1 /TAXON_ID=2966 /ORGANISM="Noctiluca scintillans" /LENGTH=135 /DNA_ID=CAMNT_0039318937 /DNA_START=69 /DNA_END=473 /DNA_ORIENTATION=+